MLYKVFYTDRFVGARFAGTTYGPFIFIRPSKKADIGLLEHEKVHVRQFWRSFGLFGIPYLLSDKARLKYEVEAYREQLKYSPHAKEHFARMIATKYKINITVEEVMKLLE